MTDAKQKLDEALRLLDEIDTTPLSQINVKLDRITAAVVAAKRTLILQDRERAAA